MPSYTEAGKMHRWPSTMARSRSRRSVQFMIVPFDEVCLERSAVLARPYAVQTSHRAIARKWLSGHLTWDYDFTATSVRRDAAITTTATDTGRSRCLVSTTARVRLR